MRATGNNSVNKEGELTLTLFAVCFSTFRLKKGNLLEFEKNNSTLISQNAAADRTYRLIDSARHTAAVTMDDIAGEINCLTVPPVY